MNSLNELFSPSEVNEMLGFAPQEALIILGLSFVLTSLVGWVYRATHTGQHYSQSYVQTLVLMGTIVSLIILIIGSNVARAFAMVGALSIVRFRNAMKETRDLGFIFMSMAIGMAVGTRAYALAGFATLVLCVFIFLMHKFNLFGRRHQAYRLLVRLPLELNAETVFQELFEQTLSQHRLIYLETVRAGVLQDAAYDVLLKPGQSSQALVEGLRQRNGNQKIQLFFEPDAEDRQLKN